MRDTKMGKKNSKLRRENSKPRQEIGGGGNLAIFPESLSSRSGYMRDTTMGKEEF